MVEYIRPYTPDFAGWLTKFGQGASNYDAHGHFARIQPMFNPFSLTSTPLLGRRPDPGAERHAAAGPRDDPVVPVPGRRDAAAADGSAPWRDEIADCDPSTVPPGP